MHVECEYQATNLDKLKSINDVEGVRYSCKQVIIKRFPPGSLTLHRGSMHEGVIYPCDQCEYKTTEIKISYRALVV